MKKKNEWKCPFCKSDKLMIDMPYIDRVTGEKKQSYCCLKQKQNADYANRRFITDSDNRPRPEEISKL